MSTLHLVVASRGSRPHVRRSPTHAQLEPLAPWFEDLLVLVALDDAGMNALLRDLAYALAQLRRGPRTRLVVPTLAASEAPVAGRRGAVWEVGLERDGDDLLVSLFRQGAAARVVQSDRRLALAEAERSLQAALEGASVSDRALAAARAALIDAEPPAPSSRVPRRALDIIGRGGRFGISVRTELRLCPTPGRRTASSMADEEDEDAANVVARTDLHALLFRGDVTFSLGNASRAVRGVYVFLAAEQLLALCEVAFRAEVAKEPGLHRFEGGGLATSVELDRRGRASLRFAGTGAEANPLRLPPVPTRDLIAALLTWCRRLGKQVVTADDSQRQNLRLTDFRQRARHLADAVSSHREAQVSVAAELLHAAPESFRAYPDDDDVPPASSPSPTVSTRDGMAPRRPKLRFDESWRADVPHLDLRALFLAGSKIIVGSPRELASIDRRTGELQWSERTHQAVSVMTPAGCMRLGADGRLTLHELDYGTTVLEMQLGPCVGASASGVVVAAPGLPSMVVLGEGARHLVAVDLDSGEVRWRRPVRAQKFAGSRIRLRRAGRLVIVSAGDAQLSALDLLSGEVVWRRPSRTCAAALTLDRGEVFVLHRDPRGVTPGHVESLDPYTGQSRWRAALPGRGASAVGASLAVTASSVGVLARTPAGMTVLGLNRSDGALRFDRREPLCEGRGACVAVDDVLIANSDRGELAAVDAVTGALRYRHVLSNRAHPDERPRTQTPVLRSGALFVPQAEVYVVCPYTGTMLGRLPCDLVPDALRADGCGGVYVAESSGYIAAYHALPTLTLVRR
ncbi:MAG: PQQ-binding-like beta-propeller repeat protein [Myxococcota bacterium]